MIFNPSLQDLFQRLEITNYSDSLSKYIEDTLLTPNQLNCNPVSLSSIQANASFLKEILKELASEDISSDLPTMFKTLLSKNNAQINSNLIFASKTAFLQSTISALVYGFIIEIRELDIVKSKNYNFNL